MNTAPIAPSSQTAMKETRQAATKQTSNDSGFGALLSQELFQRQEAPAATREAPPADPGTATSAKAPASTDDAQPENAAEEQEVAAEGTSAAAQPELLALMHSVERLMAGGSAEKTEETEGTAGVGAGTGGKPGKRPIAGEILPSLGAQAASTEAEASVEPGTRLAMQAAAASSPAAQPDTVVPTPRDFSALLQETGTTATGLPGSVAPVQAAVPQASQSLAATPVADPIYQQIGSQGWDQALGNKVVWMAGNGLQSASLSLNPPELGPLKVVLNMSGNNQATASFISNQAEVRQAIESAMPRLREMMQEAGIQLGQASVNSGTGQQQPGQPGDRNTARSAPGNESGMGSLGNTPASGSRTIAITRGTGLVDTFA